MSWSPDLYIGELRPWSDAVNVVRDLSGEERRYVPERTCRYELKDGWFVCSSCGRSTRAFEGKGDPLDPPNYCPNCGARVEVDA